MRRAAFLDRDGTLIEDVGYLARPEGIRVLPGVAEALQALRSAGFLLVIVTNQAGVARGLFTEADVHRVHEALVGLLGPFDAIFYCPHHPDGVVAPYAVACTCRKPQPGMIQEGIARFGVDPSRSFVVGDRESDLAASAGAAVPGYRVRSGPSGEGAWADLASVVRAVLEGS